VALATISAGDLRIHALDDAAYLDPAGFWIRKASRASFAIEAEAPGGREARIQLSNGGAANLVSVSSGGMNESYPLAPWEEKEIRLALEGGVVAVVIASESGFRPSDLDPRSRDERELGALIRARPAFD
jgi:hypothetical protein